MPEQITPLSTQYLLLHGAGTGVSVVLCLYHRRPAACAGERLQQLQHLQRRLQAAHAQERHRLDARRGSVTQSPVPSGIW